MKPRFYKAAMCACRLFAKLFYPYEVENGNSIPEGMACIVCSNHLSNMDPVFLNITQKRLLHFMAKKELFENKLIGTLITKLGAFPVNRGSDGGKAINMAEELLSQGECIGIFLEGTRSKTGKLGRGHMGAMVVAQQSNVPVVPCCITGKKTFIKPFVKTKITYGEPISCEELGLVDGDRRALRNAANLVMERIAQLRERQMEQFESKEKK